MAKRKELPAMSLEGRSNQLINLAVNEAEARLRNGTASSQIITTILGWASVKAQLELEKLRADIAMTKAKEKELESKATSNDLYSKALEAFRSYKGEDYDEEEEDY